MTSVATCVRLNFWNRLQTGTCYHEPLALGLTRAPRVARLQIACDFRADGCTETVPLEVLAAHRLKCEHNPRPGRQPTPGGAHDAVRPTRQGRCAPSGPLLLLLLLFPSGR